MSKALDKIYELMAEHQAACQRIIGDCQVRAAQNYEGVSMAELRKSRRESEAVIMNYMRPNLLYRPALTEENGEWVCTYGSLVARGPTPETAHQEFDRIWVGKDEI